MIFALSENCIECKDFKIKKKKHKGKKKIFFLQCPNSIVQRNIKKYT